MKKKLLDETKQLYRDIDSAISQLVKARLHHDNEGEGKAIFRMETMMVGTLQHLSCVIDLLKNVEFTNWIKVEDRLPESGIWVLISQHGVNVGLGQYINGVWWDDMDCQMDVEPTHWQEIVPPKED